ncbi:acetate permease [Burkholderia pseudomallei]|nr:acetate permease [Burkholderia pseudomallei]
MCPTTARDGVGVARLPVRPSRGCRALAPGAQVGREGDGTAAGRASYASHAMAPRVLGGSHGFAVPADRAGGDGGDGGRTLANRRPSATLTPPSRRAAEPPSRRAAEPPSRRAAEPPNRRTAEPQNRRTAEPQNRRTAEPQNRRTAEPQWPCNIEKSGAAGSSGGASRGTGAWPGRRAGVDPFDGARRCLRYRQQSKPSHPSNTNARPKPHRPNPRPTRPTGHPR